MMSALLKLSSKFWNIINTSAHTYCWEHDSVLSRTDYRWSLISFNTSAVQIFSLSVFGHTARLTQGTPAHNALHCQVGLASGRSLGRDWRRRPGRPRVRWTDQLHNDTGSVPANLWRQAILRGHGGATRRPELATRWRRRRRVQIFEIYDQIKLLVTIQFDPKPIQMFNFWILI